MAPLEESSAGKTALIVTGLGLTALVAMSVASPFAAATIAVAGRLLGQKLGDSAADLVGVFADNINDYFWDSAADPIIDGFRKSHPTVEDIYRRAFELSLKSIQPFWKSVETDQPSGNEKQDKKANYDWFSKWDHALEHGIPFDAQGIKLPRTADEADALFKSAMERLAALGTKHREGDLSITSIQTEPLPDPLFTLLKEKLPNCFDQFFRDLLVKPENATALNETTLDFQTNVLVTLGRVEKKVDLVVATTAAGLEVAKGTQQDVQGLTALVQEIRQSQLQIAVDQGRLTAAEARAEQSNAKAAEYERKYNELLQERAARVARAAEPEKAEPTDAAITRAIEAGDLDAAIQLSNQQVTSKSSETARALFERAKINELRFDWKAALADYRQAWGLSHDPDHGFKYAHFAQKLNHFKEATAAYEALLNLYTDPAERANTLNNLAILYSDTQRMRDAEQAYAEALTIRRKLAEANPDANLPGVAMTLNNLASLFGATQRMRDAEEVYSEALAIRRKLAQANPDAYLPDVATTLNNLGLLYRATQRMQDAEEALAEALAAYRMLARSNPDAYLPCVATLLNNLGLLYSTTQRMSRAEEAYAEALAIRRKLAQDNPDAYLVDVATTLNNLGLLYADTQRMSQAEEAYAEALAIRRKLAEDNPDAYLPYVALTLNNLAILHNATQRMEKAEEAYAEALAIRRQLAQANPDAYQPNVAITLNNLAALYGDTERMRDAEEAYAEALAIRRKLAEANPDAYLPYVATTLNNLANLYRATQRMRDAEQAYAQALAIRRKLAEANPDAYLPYLASLLNNLASFSLSTGQMQEAEKHASEAERVLDPLWQANPALHGNLMAKILGTRSEIAEADQRPATEACDLARRALAAAYDPGLKQQIQQLIDRLCPEAKG